MNDDLGLVQFEKFYFKKSPSRSSRGNLVKNKELSSWALHCRRLIPDRFNPSTIMMGQMQTHHQGPHSIWQCFKNALIFLTFDVPSQFHQKFLLRLFWSK